MRTSPPSSLASVTLASASSLRLRGLALGALLFAAAPVGCGGDPAVRSARNGDLPGVQKELDARAASGKLDRETVREVALAVLEHDVDRYEGDEGVRRTWSLVACARPLRAPLNRLSKRADDIGATAAMVLIDADLESKDAFTDAHKDDPVARWRAVATRGLVDREESAIRATRSRDDDRWVRLAAVQAAGDAGCPDDFPMLLDAARRDPDVMVRVTSVRSLDHIAPRLDEGTRRADLVDRLLDLWRGGDEPLRGAVARAWGSPALVEFGGRRELLGVVGSGFGHPTVEAASALMLSGAPEGEHALLKLATQGDAEVRAHAIRLLDVSRPAHLDALTTLLAEPDPQKPGPVDDPRARGLAAETILRAPEATLAKAENGAKLRQTALDALQKLSSRTDRVGVDAALALADAGVVAVRERLQKELAIPSPIRARVAFALVRLGFAADVRGLLVDADVDVRDAVACQVVVAR
jgi:hypothetical protein